MVANKKAPPVPAQGRGHQRPHLRPVPPVGEEHRSETRPGAGRLPGGHERPDPPLPPGLPRARLQRRRRDDVQEQVARSHGWHYMQPLWAVRPPAVALLQLHAGPAAERARCWVAWDHVARLTNALQGPPDDFVAFPAPTGPKGRAYMPVLAGLAIPKTAPNAAGAKALIRLAARRQRAGEDARLGRVLPGRRRTALEAARRRPAG